MKTKRMIGDLNPRSSDTSVRLARILLAKIFQEKKKKKKKISTRD